MASSAHADTTAALGTRLSELITQASLGDGIGIAIADLASGESVYTQNASTPRNPASNMKLITAAAALHELGADYQMRTTLSGSIGDDGAVDTVVLHGEGDPSLAFSDLLIAAQRLTALGVRRVDHILVDGSYFDDQVLPPAFDQQPNEIATFRAPVSAVSVDRNAFELRLSPGPAVDAPANVILQCPDHFALDASVTTAAKGTPRVYADQREQGSQLALRVSGEVPIGIRGVGYHRRIASPLPYAGHCLRAALRAQNIGGPMEVRVGPSPGGLATLYVHESAPLSTLLSRVGKNSDNFYAEMLLKVIGAHATGRPGSSAAGVRRAKQLLQSAGVDSDQLKMINGSGLFIGNAIAPEHFVKVLLLMYRDPAVRAEYVSQLAVGGHDGTLTNRIKDLPAKRIVRAKTGTLNDAIALSGYVLGRSPEQGFAFSFLFNGIAGRQWQARALADDLVRALSAVLYGKH